jgi:hypothetical protein
MTTNDSKFRLSTDRERSGRGAAEEEVALPPSADPVGRYGYVVNAAPLETIERATAEMLEALSPADGARIRDRLDHFPELHGEEPMEAVQADALLARFVAQAEKRRPGALERAVRAGVPTRAGEELFSVLARAFVSTPAASAFLSRLEADRGHTLETEPESDPDFSDEFGYESGYAGGSGFENVEFDRWT